MTIIEVPSGTQIAGTWPGGAETWLDGRFRLDERISISEHIHGTCGASWEEHGLSLWKATDRLLGRPVTIYLLPQGRPVPPVVVGAVRAAAKVADPRLANIYDTDFAADCPLHRVRVDAGHPPRGPRALGPAQPGPGRRHDRRRR